MHNITIIVPVYNVEKYLFKCLSSIQNQTNGEFNVILINDGSTDSSQAICEDFVKKDKRFTLINQKNAGLSSARNTGIKNTKTDYLLFVDSDDYIDSYLIEKMYYNLNSSTDLIVFNVNIVDDDYIEKKKIWSIEYGTIHSIEALKNDFLIQPCWAWNKLYRTSIIKDNNITFPEGLTYEDVPFFIEYITSCNTINYISDYLYYYRTNRKGSITNKKTLKCLDTIRIKNNVDNILKHKHTPAWINENFREWTISNYAWMYTRAPFYLKHLLILYFIKCNKKINNDILTRMNMRANIYKIFFIDTILVLYYRNKTKYFLFNIIPFIKIKK